MTESQFIFGRTRAAINERLNRIEQSLRENTENMFKMDHDGDMMDDPELFRLNNQRVALLGEQIILQRYLYDNEDRQTPPTNEKVDVGHAVDVDIRHPDGVHDHMQITIGSVLDQKFLVQGKEVFEDPNQLLVSSDSPLAQILIGKTAGERLQYEVNGGEGELTILSVKESPLLRS